MPIATIPSQVPELAGDNWDDVTSQLDGIPTPAPRAERPPSPPTVPPAQAARTAAERAPATTDTGADDAAATPTANETAPAKTEATEPAPPERTTYPAWWKGTEEEWQKARAESNRAANRERDRADKAEQNLRDLTERLALLEAQIGQRDTSFRDLAAQVYRDPQQADTLLSADRQRGNDAYLHAKELRDREAARAQAAAEQAADSARSQDAKAEAYRLELYATNLVLANEYADGLGVVGLKAGDILKAEFTKPENARLLAISQSSTVSPEDAQAATEELYARAHASWKALVDTTAQAKQRVTQGEDDTAAGRKTALGTTNVSGGAADDWTPDGAEAELTAYYAEQDRRAGGHYRAPHGQRVAAAAAI